MIHARIWVTGENGLQKQVSLLQKTWTTEYRDIANLKPTNEGNVGRSKCHFSEGQAAENDFSRLEAIMWASVMSRSEGEDQETRDKGHGCQPDSSGTKKPSLGLRHHRDHGHNC